MRVQRAIAFIDLCGFTSFMERHGDEQVVLVLAELRAALRKAASRRGVRVARWLGDGAMVAATEPAPLLALLIEIDQHMSTAVPSLAVRAGIDAGPVVMFEGDDYIGTCVNIASRLCDRAGPHEVLATTTVAGSRPLWVESTSAGLAEIRGITDCLPVRHLTLRSDGTATDPVCGLSLSPPHGTHAIGNLDDTFCSQSCADTWTEAALRDDRPASTHPSRTDADRP